MIISRFIHVAANGITSYFFMLALGLRLLFYFRTLKQVQNQNVLPCKEHYDRVFGLGGTHTLGVFFYALYIFVKPLCKGEDLV